MDPLVTIRCYTSSTEAHLDRLRLEQQGIHAEVQEVGHLLSYSLTTPGIRLLVAREDAEAAVGVLDEQPGQD